MNILNSVIGKALLLTLSIMVTFQSLAEEIPLKPTNNPLKDALGKPLANGGFSRDGFHLWDPSIIKVGEKYHMIASCWPVENFNAWKKSFVIRAVSENLLGPYTFAEVVLQPGGKGFDAHGCHNPKITFHKGKYYLYYLGIPGWRSGLAVSDSIEGPWERISKTVIPLNNPALWIHKDGTVYGVGKRKDKYAPESPHKTALHKRRLILEVVKANDIQGPYISLTPRGKSGLPKDYEHEDPCIWYDGETYHMLVIDWRGFATGHTKGFTYYRSKTGINYELVSPIPIISREDPIIFSDDSKRLYRRIERPNIVLNQHGNVIALLAACLPKEEGKGAEILVFPMKLDAQQDPAGDNLRVPTEE